MSNNNRFTTPVNSNKFSSSVLRSNAVKRDSLAAELERDPQLSTAKRQQRTQAFSSHMAHTSLERQVAAAQTSKLELESKLREKDLLIERLEGDRRWLAEREKEEREEKEREREEHLEDKRKADGELRSLRTQLMTLREQHVDLEEERSDLTRSTSQTIAGQKAQIATLTRQVSLLENQLQEFQRLAEERARAFDELQAQFDELNAAQDSLTLGHNQDEDWAVVREELHRQATYMRQLESTNAKMGAELNFLRERHTSIEVVKEQNRSLQRKLRGMDELREQVVKLEAELQAARKERQEWASSSAEPATPSNTPVSVTQSLSNLRLTHARLMEEHGSTVALLRHREQELSELQESEAQTQKSVKELRAEVRELKDRALRNDHKATLAEREVSFLRAMLASFNAEDAANGETKSENDASITVQELETLVRDYKAMVSDLERELKDARANPVIAEELEAKQRLLALLEQERTAREEAENALKEAETESEKQLEQIENLEQTLFELQGEIGAGRHLPPGVRVLSLHDNPAQQWEDLSKARMDRLRKENQALLKRLEDLEKSGLRSFTQDSSLDLVPRASYEAAKQEKEDMAIEVEIKEKQKARLKEMFVLKSAEFRHVIATLLGLKLTFVPNGSVRVVSKYDLGTSFEFHPNEYDGMKLRLSSHAGGPEDLPQLVQYWIEQEQCIPGLLASVTLECYDKQKREQKQQ